MGTQKLFMLKSHFNFVDKGLLSEFVYRIMLRLGNFFWVLVRTFMLNLFGFVVKYIYRFQADDDSHKNDSNFSVVHSEQDDQIVSNSSEDSESDGFCEKETSEFSFGFRFQTSRDFNRSIAETESSGFMDSALTASTSKYQFMADKDVSGFMEEPETMSFTVQEMFTGSHEEKVRHFCEGSNCSSIVNDQLIARVSTSSHLQELVVGEAVNQEKAEDHVKSLFSEEALEKQEQVTSAEEHELSENKEKDGSEDNLSDKQYFSYEFQLLREDQFLPSDSKPESDSSSDEFLVSTHKFDSVNNEFYSNRHVNEGLEPDTLMPIDQREVEFIDEIPCLEEISTDDMSMLDGEIVVSRCRAEDSDDEYIELEPQLQNSSELDKEIFSWKDCCKVEDLDYVGSTHSEGTEPMDGLGKSEEHSSERKSWFSDSDDEDGPDILLEHRDLIEQMKMELKNARTRGLPTILEESETPKMAEDLKPLKIDEKFEHKDCMEEIQKFYKSYTEKMRKLDILNYQTMQAISFLQLKDPTQLTSGQKSSFLAIKSLILPKFWPCKLRRIYADPTLKSVNTELHRGLEIVYVGQVCLSWEMLQWQYGKAKELLKYDSQGHFSYNQVAGEFQQFQVLVQRFIEDEPFQGPRVQNNVKNRCILRSLLQVPPIKDDCLKDKKGRIEEEKDAISIAMLAEIIGESMQLFWEFLRADKDEANVILEGLQGIPNNLQDPADSELLTEIKTSLQKKEKRLKDILRSGNCIVKKIQKHQGGRLDHALFLSQVELRLVSRVLCLSRLTTDQLLWCQKKLHNIKFVNRKIHVEPSFLLFPC